MSKILIFVLIISDLVLPGRLGQNLRKKIIPSSTLNKAVKVTTEKTTATPQVGFQISDLPVKLNEQNIYPATSKVVYAIDLNTNFTLINKSSNEKVPMASLTKLMTAYLAFEKLDPEKTLTVTPVYLEREDTKMGLVEGERIKVNDLEYGLLVQSAGDAAVVLAREISGNETAFANLMNVKAQELGLEDTHFTNPIGLDDKNHFSSAKDLVSLTRILLMNPRFRQIVATKDFRVKSQDGRIHRLENTNKILDNNVIYGVKTGTTDLAGECLIFLAKINNREVLVAVLGSPSRYMESTNIINWISQNFK